MLSINPYLNFPGNTEEAFNFYKSVFGGEFAMVIRFGDMGGTPDMPPIPDDIKDKLMHIALPIGGNMLMGTDAIESMGHTITPGTNFHLSLNLGSKEETDTKFAALAAGGKVTQEPKVQSWGDYFGMCTDKFGISWMFSFNEKYNNQ